MPVFERDGKIISGDEYFGSQFVVMPAKKPIASFNIEAFQGCISLAMNPQHAEEVAAFIRSVASERVPKHLWAFAEHCENSARRARAEIARAASL